ncbi:MAG: phospho-N-acetylmuramoyl-pentapeptide-transferase [Alphaproteobacteria bacterium]|nr:phospho-N-acetylmuramoyl-pentapeptide-transferase [Alphaproteobacteria bacterium]MBN2779696.1 phospho-N-acetylmuramoyl-pentapeptide-transferase [Alphaproteobacteria bacterium]
MLAYLTDLYHLSFFSFLTVRSFLALLTALFMSLLLGSRVIAFLRHWQGKGQPIRADGPKSHLAKKGTPTMGGFLWLSTLLLSLFLWGNWVHPYLLILLFVTFSFAAIGFFDDYYKVKKRNSAGLPGKLRLLLETICATVAVVAISYFTPDAETTKLVLPFVKAWQFDIGYLYYALGVFVIVGSANAVNITDGLDGLSTLTSISATFVFMILAYLIGRVDFSAYLFLPYLSNATELVVFAGALLGSLFGFLWFNVSPAKVWMGDMGSLPLGAIFGTMAIMTKSEFVWAIAGALFVFEILSVILQVAYFKRTGGKRIFKMAPLHHHFELSGWKETTVVFRFWILSLIFALIALATLKLR